MHTNLQLTHSVVNIEYFPLRSEPGQKWLKLPFLFSIGTVGSSQCDKENKGEKKQEKRYILERKKYTIHR